MMIVLSLTAKHEHNTQKGLISIRIASSSEAAAFRAKYCHSASSRSSIADEFTVSAASFEQLLPDKSIISYASGAKRITKAFIMFEVIDSAAGIAYYPVFSESVGKRMLIQWGLPIPKKMKLFDTGLAAYSRTLPAERSDDLQNDNNRALRTLIVFSRSMTILRFSDPKPMNKAMKSILDELEKDHDRCVSPDEIKCVNDEIKSYLVSRINTENENFSSLKDYLNIISQKYKVRLIDHDFHNLRQVFNNKYPAAPLYF